MIKCACDQGGKQCYSVFDLGGFKLGYICECTVPQLKVLSQMPAQPHEATCSLFVCSLWEGEENQKGIRETTGLRLKKNNNRESKSCSHKQCKMSSFTTFHGQASVQPFPVKQGSITCIGDSETKNTISWKESTLPSSPPCLYNPNMTTCRMGHPFDQLGSVVLAVSTLNKADIQEANFVFMLLCLFKNNQENKFSSFTLFCEQ